MLARLKAFAKIMRKKQEPGQSGGFHHKCTYGKPMFDQPQRYLWITEPPLLPSPG
jgi:hypothetical protein